MKPMGVVVWVVAAALAGCASGDEPVTDASTDEVRIVSMLSGNRTLTAPAAPAGFNLTGVGWGQFTVASPESLTLTLSHPDLSLKTPFNDFDQVYYGPGNYTVVHATDGKNSQEFVFLGSNAGFHAPERDSLERGPVFSLAPGEWTITVANSVPGYQLSLDAGKGWYEFPLGPRSGFFGGSAPQTEAGGFDEQVVRVQSEYHFVQELPAQPPSLIALLAWDSKFSMRPAPMVHAAVGSWNVAVEPMGTPVAADGELGPARGFGSFSGSSHYLVEETTETQDLQAVFAARWTGVVLGTHDEGLTVVAMPLD